MTAARGRDERHMDEAEDSCRHCRRELTSDLQRNPVDGFSAGLVDDDNILEWSIVIMG